MNLCNVFAYFHRSIKFLFSFVFYQTCVLFKLIYFEAMIFLKLEKGLQHKLKQTICENCEKCYSCTCVTNKFVRTLEKDQELLFSDYICHLSNFATDSINIVYLPFFVNISCPVVQNSF